MPLVAPTYPLDETIEVATEIILAYDRDFLVVLVFSNGFYFFFSHFFSPFREFIDQKYNLIIMA